MVSTLSSCQVCMTTVLLGPHPSILLTVSVIIIKKLNGEPWTCLTNYKGPTSHHIMVLFINGLEDGDTHTHTHARMHSHMHSHTHTHTHAHAHTHTHTQTHTHICTHASMSTFVDKKQFQETRHTPSLINWFTFYCSWIN